MSGDAANLGKRCLCGSIKCKFMYEWFYGKIIDFESTYTLPYIRFYALITLSYSARISGTRHQVRGCVWFGVR